MNRVKYQLLDYWELTYEWGWGGELNPAGENVYRDRKSNLK